MSVIVNKICVALCFFIVHQAYAQKKQCYCKSNPEITNAVADCRVTRLQGGGALYWQFNCNRIWLTLENNTKKKIVIDEVPLSLSGYTYRLGYQLSKEYKNALLFRSGCPANGPCNFVLIDKYTGKKIKEFGELIYNDPNSKFYDFVIYLISPKVLVIHYIDTNKRYSIRIAHEFKALIPEYEFDDVRIEKNVLVLVSDGGNIRIDLSKYPR